MKKRKIAFVIKNMKMGGPRVSLISLMEEISRDSNNQVDLIVMNQKGPLLERIPDTVNLITEDHLIKIAVAEKEDLNSLEEFVIRGGIYIAKKIFGYNAVYKHIYRRFGEKLKNREYDLVVGFQEGESNDLAAIIPGRKHIIWYHSNFKTYHLYENGIRLLDLYDIVDKIVFVTVESCNFFKEKNEKYSKKCLVIRNTIPVKKIKTMAKSDIECVYKSKFIRFVSVGRVSPEKGYDRAINVAKKLKNEGFKFEWIIIGAGGKLKEYQKIIREDDLDETIRFIGERKNPYQIVNQADILILPSYSEAQPLVVLEGLILGKPFIATNFDSAKESLDEKCGFIVDNSEEGIYIGIRHALMDLEKLQDKKRNAELFTYTNQEILDDLYALI